MKKEKVSILFVCMGNICRSPAAEGIFKHYISQDPNLEIHVESCGIGNWHIGKAPDQRIQEASQARGIILMSQAQQFQDAFLDQFDYILAADKEVLHFLDRYAKTSHQKEKIFLMTAFSRFYKNQEVPDPYYQADRGFELVLDMLEDSCQGLLQHIRHRSSSSS